MFGMLNFGEQMLIVVRSAKHVLYLLVVSDKTEKSSRWKHVVLIETEDVANKKLRL